MEGGNEIRKDAIENRFVIVAPGRGDRPGGGLLRSSPGRHGLFACRLCSRRIDREESLLEIPDGRGGWRVKVVANKFPILSRDSRVAYGRHELIIETPRGDRPFESFSVPEIESVLSAFSSRIEALRRDRKLKFVTVFKNVGPAAGASKAHAHSQLIASAVVPSAVKDLQSRVGAATKRGGCPYCGLVKSESRGPRLVAATKSVIAIAPFASVFPYEVWIMPRRHRCSLTGLTAIERRDLSKTYGLVAGFLARRRLDWNMAIEEIFGAEEMHCGLRIFPRGTIWAGMELETGMVTNPIPPERAAAEYREFLSP